MNRRIAISNIAKGALALPAVSLLAHAQAVSLHCGSSPGKNAHFTNIAVRNQYGERARFYDDLVKDKIVMINFFSTRGDAQYPVTDNLAKVANKLGDRLGRDIFMYSISVDPEYDTPPVLKEFAKSHRIPQGWSLLTGTSADIQTLRNTFFTSGAAGGDHHQHAGGMDCSRGLVRIGNDGLNRWASVPARNSVEHFMAFVSFMDLGTKTAAKTAEKPAART
jgi:protein SCO1/2